MKRGWVWLLVTLVVVSLVAGGYSYSQVKLQPKGVAYVRPMLSLNLGSALAAGSSFLTGDRLGGSVEALAALVDGVRVDAEVGIRNGGLLPVYLPATKHVITVDGQRPGDYVTTIPGVWLLPDESYLETVSVVIPVEDIPTVAMTAIVNGGQVRVNIRSTGAVFGIPISNETEFIVSVLDPVRRLLRGDSD